MTESAYPKDLLYTKDHEWARVEHSDGQRLVTIGITRFAVDHLGDVTQVDLPKAGQTVKQAEIFGSVESVKAVSDVFAPVSGTVVTVNASLATSPEAVNEDPYAQGWMITVAPTNPDELGQLMGADAYATLLREQAE
jgi:glycine cleavage system H protein